VLVGPVAEAAAHREVVSPRKRVRLGGGGESGGNLTPKRRPTAVGVELDGTTSTAAQAFTGTARSWERASSA
jgi:hypothetical protein